MKSNVGRNQARRLDKFDSVKVTPSYPKLQLVGIAGVLDPTRNVMNSTTLAAGAVNGLRGPSVVFRCELAVFARELPRETSFTTPLGGQGGHHCPQVFVGGSKAP